MAWIVTGEKDGFIELVSKSDVDGLLPKGSYLTIEQGASKFILRVDKSIQSEPYAPSPMIVDMDLAGLAQDQKCQNIIQAFRVMDLNKRTDGKIDFIRPQSIARRSTQEEVDLAMNSGAYKGPKVFIATIHAGQNQLLVDDEQKYISATLPEEMYFHQVLICGKTGSGKTVATKYLAQYFVEELEGAVLAINVKDVDFLKMNRATVTRNPAVIREWDVLEQKPHEIDNFTVYYPANTDIRAYRDLDLQYFERITLSVDDIEPEALIGLLQGISDIGAQNLPDIFRYWKYRIKEKGDTFNDFVNYFTRTGEEENRQFPAMNSRGDDSILPLHAATYTNVQRVLVRAVEFFDNQNAKVINETDILVNGKMSVINVGNQGMQFGSILLRHLLSRIVEAKALNQSNVPILIIIDEVHNFYNTDASQEALGDLDTICRQGRSQKIGVIFSSQNPDDIPRGLASVINTKIFFRTDAGTKSLNVKISSDELESLRKGYAVVNIHDMAHIKIIKFPLACAGVFE